MVSLLKNVLCDVIFVVYDDELKFMSLNLLFYLVCGIKILEPKSSRPGNKRANVYLKSEKKEYEKLAKADFARIRKHDEGSNN